MRINTKKHEHALGFTLMEVLIAMLILAIGVLGIVALQFKGLQYNQDAYFRSQVNILAYDIMDRMRLNQADAATYATSLATNWPVDVTAPTGCDQTGTDAVGTANDIACWQLQLFQALPPGSTADINNDGGGLFTITIGWTDREGTPHNITYTFQP
jgi:type IV pilus assembly protein PilV